MGSTALHLPADRTAADYLRLDPITAAANSLDQGGLRPVRLDTNPPEDPTAPSRSFSIAFWLRYEAPLLARLVKDRNGNQVGELLTIGNYFSVVFWMEDVSRALALEIAGDYGRRIPTHRVNTVILPGEWTHLAFVFTYYKTGFPGPGSQTGTVMDVYQNGRWVGSTALPAPPIPLPLVPYTLNEFTIGKGYVNDEQMQGSSLDLEFDDLIIVNDPLAAAQVRDLFTGTAPPAVVGMGLLAAYWDFEATNPGGSLADMSGAFTFVRAAGSGSAIETTSVVRPSVSPSTLPFLPYTEEEETLFQEALQLAANPVNFDIQLAGVDAGALIDARGLWSAREVAARLEMVRDVLRIPSTTFAQSIAPGSGPLEWSSVVTPSILPTLAYLYTLDESWNPYFYGRPPFAAGLRNRVLVNALTDLLYAMSYTRAHPFTPDWVRLVGFRWTYSAAVCNYLCPLLAPDVARAWLLTLDRAAQLIWAHSSAEDLDAFGTWETDTDLPSVLLTSLLLSIDEKLGADPSLPARHLAMLDAMMKVFTAVKTRGELEQRNNAKGFTTAGYCIMDGGIVPTYNGLCEDHLTAAYAILSQVTSVDVASYRTALLEVLRRAARLASYNTLVDSRGSATGKYLSDSSYAGRVTSSPGFAQRGIHDSFLVLLDVISPDHTEQVAPLVWRYLERIYIKYTIEPFVPEPASFAFLREKARVDIDHSLQRAADAVQIGYYVLRAENVGRPSLEMDYREWGPWLQFVVTAHMSRGDLAAMFEQTPPLHLYPTQNRTPFIERFGDAGEETFHVIQLGNYTATVFTGFHIGTAPARGGGGGVLGAFQVRLPGQELPTSVIPIKGGYVGDWRRSGRADTKETTAEGTCITYARVARSSTLNHDPACAYLTEAGRYDWLSWPANHVLAVPAGSIGQARVVGADLYTDHYYNLDQLRFSEGRSRRPRRYDLTLEKPLHRTYAYYPDGDPPSPCALTGAAGACVSRTMKFRRRGVRVAVQVDRFQGSAQPDLLADAARVYEVLPVFFASGFPHGQEDLTNPENTFSNEVVQFCGRRRRRLWPALNMVQGVRQIIIRQEVSAGNTALRGGAVVQFRKPVSIRTDSTPVWHSQGSAGAAMYTKNLLVELPRKATSSGDTSFVLDYIIRPLPPRSRLSCR